MQQRQPGLTRRAVLKRVAGGVVALVLTTTVAACGGRAATTGASASATTSTRTLAMPTSTSSAAKAAAKPTSTPNNSLAPVQATAVASGKGEHLAIWWPFGGHPYAVDQAWAAFQQQHPSWSAEITYTNDYTKFLAAVAAGTPPDIYMPAAAFLLLISYKQLVRPLDPYIARDKVDMQQYFPAALLGITYKNHFYGMPHHSDVQSLYQNDALLREVGLDPTQAPQSWADLAALNLHLVKRQDNAPVRLGFNPIWGSSTNPIGWFQANGVPLVNATGTAVAFDTLAGLEALTWVQTQVRELGGLTALQTYQKAYHHGSGDALAHDALGTELQGVWDLAQTIFNEAPHLALSQWSMPGGPSAQGKQFDYFGVTALVIPVGSKQPEQAWSYAKYASSYQGQLFVQRAPGAWDQACLPKAANDPVSLLAQPWRKRANELMAKATAYGYWPTPGSIQIAAAFNEPWGGLIAGKTDPKTALAEMKQAVQTEMDKYQA